MILVLIICITIININNASIAKTISAPKALPKTAIIGGGPAGLTTAIALAKRGYRDITVYDKLTRPPASDSDEWMNSERSYTIGLNGRGQNALRKLGIMKKIDQSAVSVLGRLDWSPTTATDSPNENIFKGRSYTTKVLQRDRIVSCCLV